MFDRLKEASKILILPAALLYLLGFICVNAYLARFGIISFDAINPRFILAGVYPLISLAVVIFLSWRLYKRIPIQKLFETKSWKLRFIAHSDFIILVLAATFVLTQLMNLGVYKFPLKQELLVFKPIFGAYDFIGDMVSNLPAGSLISIEFVAKVALYVFLYLFILALLITFFVIIYGWFSNRPIKFDNTHDAKSADKKIGTSETSQPTKKETKYSGYKRFLIGIVDILIISIYISFLLYSWRKIGIELFDFSSFSKSQPVNLGLVFAWLFSSTFVVYIFLMNTEIPAEQLKLKFSEYISNFGNLQWSFQQLFIPVLASILTFGTTIFPKIPFVIGGGEPRLVKMSTSTGQDKINKEMFLIGENSQFFFTVVTNNESETSKALQISKNTVLYIETKNATWTKELSQ